MNERVAREGGKLAIARCSMRRQSIARFLPFSFLIADTFSVNEPRQLTLCCVSTGPKAAKSHHYNKDESLRSWTLAAFLELRREKCPAVRPAPTPPPPPNSPVPGPHRCEKEAGNALQPEILFAYRVVSLQQSGKGFRVPCCKALAVCSARIPPKAVPR